MPTTLKCFLTALCIAGLAACSSGSSDDGSTQAPSDPRASDDTLHVIYAIERDAWVNAVFYADSDDSGTLDTEADEELGLSTNPYTDDECFYRYGPVGQRLFAYIKPGVSWDGRGTVDSAGYVLSAPAGYPTISPFTTVLDRLGEVSLNDLAVSIGVSADVLKGNYLPVVDTLDDTTDDVKIIRAVATYITNGLQNNALMAEILDSVDDLMPLVNDALANDRNPATIGYLFTYDGPRESGNVPFSESLLTGTSSSKTWSYYRLEDNGNTLQGTVMFTDTNEVCVSTQVFVFNETAPALPVPSCSTYTIADNGPVLGVLGIISGNLIGLGSDWVLQYRGALKNSEEGGSVLIAINGNGHIFWLDSEVELNAPSDKTIVVNTPYYVLQDINAEARTIQAELNTYTFASDGNVAIDASEREWGTVLLSSTGLFASDLTAVKTVDPEVITNDHYFLDYRVAGNFSLVYSGSVVPGGTDVQESLSLWSNDKQAMDQLYESWCASLGYPVCYF